MKDPTPTTNISPLPSLTGQVQRPAILVAYSPESMSLADRFSVQDVFVAGRSSTCDLTVLDRQISKQHFRITSYESGGAIEDLKSTNGTYLNGRRIKREEKLMDQAVMRIGQVVLVFVEDGGLLLEPPYKESFGIAGVYHTNSLLAELREAALSERSILLAGPTGSGKELAAGAIRSLTSGREADAPFVAHNAGLFATEDEATSTLFGVGAKVFSGVDARIGLIDKANGGTLFLDEIDSLPARVQQSLLRVIEEKKSKRIGETGTHEVDVRFVFASNKVDPTCRLAPDLFARLRVVGIPPLLARVADVPSIFNAILGAAAQNSGIDASLVFPLLSADHYEAMCLDGFKKDNVRGLIDIVDKLITKISSGVSAAEALSSVFNERFKNGPVVRRSQADSQDERQPRRRRNSHYEKHKDTIVDVFREQKGNASATQRILREMGISCSRRWIVIYTERWGVRK